MSRALYPWQAVQTVRENGETTAKQFYQERVAELERSRATLKNIAGRRRELESAARASTRALALPPQGCLAIEARRRADYAEALRLQSDCLRKS
jgi:hypothetical protein